MEKRVLVFRTSVAGHEQIENLRPKLDQLICGNDMWNFDLEDCDNILRVESMSIAPDAVASALLHHGHNCKELSD